MPTGNREYRGSGARGAAALADRAGDVARMGLPTLLEELWRKVREVMDQEGSGAGHDLAGNELAADDDWADFPP